MAIGNERPVYQALNASNVENRVAYTSCFGETDSREIHLMEHGRVSRAQSGAKEWLPCDLDY